MGILNLTLAELLTILLPLSGVIVALYFYDRSRRRRVVSSLFFWPQQPDPPMVTRRRKLQQPWSLLLQVLALTLLLLAVADLRLGNFGGRQRRHVLILDTSVWMAAASEDGGRTLMELARERARAYLRAIPPDEAVMLVRADGNPAPATAFTTNRAELGQAIEESQPGWTAADLASALELARSAVRISLGIGVENEQEESSQPAFGEIAYVGTGRVADPQEVTTTAPHFRFISVDDAVSDSGVTRLAARRVANDPERWEVVTEIRNDSAEERPLRVGFSFDGRPIGERAVRLAPSASGEITFRLRTKRAGLLAAKIEPGDSFPENDQTEIHVPTFTARRVDVYSASPGRWRALLESNPRIEAEFHSRAESAPGAGSLAIFDRLGPGEKPAGGAIYVDPPRDESPVAILRVARNVKITQWNPGHPVAKGLRSTGTALRRASILEAAPGDIVIAECEEGPVIVARSDAGRKEVVFGFHPAEGELQNQLLAPLVFANTIAWMVPEAFRASEVAAQSPGLVELDIGEESEENVSVTSSENADLPWVLRDGRLRFYAGSPGTVTVRTPSLETQLALNLPRRPGGFWEPPQGALRGVPRPVSRVSAATAILWPWLALAGLACLIVEWKLYGRASRAGVAPLSRTTERPAAPIGGVSMTEQPGRTREKELAL